jgi:hypothetical protein
MQDRLKQLEMERGMPNQQTQQPQQPQQSHNNMNNMFAQSNNSNQNLNAMFNNTQPLSQSQSQPQYQPPPQPQHQPQPQQQLQELMRQMNEMKSIMGNMKQENDFLRNQLENQKKTSIKSFQLEVTKKESKYDFQFNQINNIVGLKLASYNLPQPLYNIIDDTRFEYNINEMNKYIIISKGNYNIDTLLYYLNNNDDLIFSLDITQKINIKSKNDINFNIIINNFSKKLGFDNIVQENNIIANRIYDLRHPSKLLLYIRNIYEDKPIGLLNFNGTSICEINFEKPINLDKLQIEFYTEDNILYNFNNIFYNLSFIINIIN